MVKLMVKPKDWLKRLDFAKVKRSVKQTDLLKQMGFGKAMLTGWQMVKLMD